MQLKKKTRIIKPKYQNLKRKLKGCIDLKSRIIEDQVVFLLLIHLKSIINYGLILGHFGCTAHGG